MRARKAHGPTSAPTFAPGLAVLLAVLLAMLLTTLSGCSSWGPPAPPPGPTQALADTPPSWSNVGAAGAAGAGAYAVTGDSLVAWWQRFDDPLLAQLVARALQHNTTVAGARAALREAQALHDLAGAALQPTLGATASAQRGTAAGHSTPAQWALGLNGQWLPDLFGARRSAWDAAGAVADSSAAVLGQAQVQLASGVARSYIVLRLAQARRALAVDNGANQLETLQITDWRKQAGLVTVLEVQQARAAAAQTQAQLPALQISIEQSAHALALLLGLPPTALQGELGTQAAGTAAAHETTTATTATPALWPQALPPGAQSLQLDIPAETLRQRADIQAAEFRVAAAWARVAQAQAQRWPSFAIGGSIGLNAATLATLGSSAAVLGSVLASVSLPLWDGGAAQAQVRAQQAALEGAEHSYRAAVLTALQEVEDTLAALRGHRLRLEQLRLAADAASQAALLARQRYSSGLVDFQVVLETQRTRLQAQDTVVTARADYSDTQVRLFTALGGGWRLAGARP